MFEQNQTVATKVPDETGQLSWVLTKYVKFDDITQRYVVQDVEKPDQFYNLEIHHIKQFPEQNLQVVKGDKLYTVWYIVDQQQWTNTLYQCTALENYPDLEEPDSMVLCVQFEEDVKPYLVNKQWIAKNLD